MSDAIIPKEQLTAYQRWELPNFSGGMAGMTSTRVSAAELPTAEQLERIHLQARDEGYQAGFAEGAQKTREEAQRIAGLGVALGRELRQLDQEIVQSLLNLALEVAKKMTQQAFEIKPELLLNVIRDAISSLPHFNQSAHLVLHPADAGLVRAGMGEQLAHTGWKIIEDSQMVRGGCRVETANSQIDATLATRWEHVVASIGLDNTWLTS